MKKTPKKLKLLQYGFYNSRMKKLAKFNYVEIQIGIFNALKNRTDEIKETEIWKLFWKIKTRLRHKFVRGLRCSKCLEFSKIQTRLNAGFQFWQEKAPSCKSKKCLKTLKEIQITELEWDKIGKCDV